MALRGRLVIGLAVCVLASLASGVAYADQPGTASDGAQFQNQSATTQSAFTSTFGQACAPQEWVWQHTLAVDPDQFDGPAASDGQTFGNQDDDTQLPFVALFGTRASAEWVAEHNAVTAHRVLLGTVAPVPCPPAASAAATVSLIGTTHLRDAIGAANAGNASQAADLFGQFKVIWAAARPKLSATLAQPVQDAVDQVNSPPSAATLQTVLRSVRTANTGYAQGGEPATSPTGAPGASPTTAPATSPPAPAGSDDSDP